METLTLREKMPEKLHRLPELAHNLWWSWNTDARILFKRLDKPLWRSTQHNPVQMLYEMSAADLEERAQDPAFIRYYNKIVMRFDEELSSENSWFETTYPEHKEKTIAYFSAEFGLHGSLPIYSGGLGILSGDHVKEASDIGLNFVGVGFMYPQGYFRQRIPTHGWQEAIYQQLDMEQSPIDLMRDEQDNPIKISVQIGDSAVCAQIWRVYVGRVSLYMMDTNVPENDPWNRELSARLYSGDSEVRIRQEMMLASAGCASCGRWASHPRCGT